MINTAYAMGQGGAAGGQGAGGFTSLIPIILMFVIFYFLLIRPQQKKAKEHKEMISQVRKGDRIVTSGGLHGRVTAVGDTTLTVEIADRVRVKIARGNLSQVVKSSSPSQDNKKK
ncbi:MAG: preprotein translocase subunit YajC [Desulfobacteraceae bacterium]|nr:preprotein translocase subunit YajC [Desulfobacteraceae bacterium]MDH3575486.1 preprotein translocase subunit YajC [Desulfobacteraceae bacterium]MDH3720264.1 preprotein translocase subunit YajC [Desulfobacteraceae bacterium]MDH3836030.1 preprotein translocase subunit YajC [Desulfobacteraceae bacterium]MDH3872844.1 preprotein translocase subunit YajC [Desulfobacteraceae bacterium]